MRKMCAAAILCLSACGGPEEMAESEADEPIESVAAHVLPFARPLGPGTAAKLTYWGGPVVESAKVVAVLWGSSVDPQVAGKIGAFYKAVVAGPYFSWLAEYDTRTQHIRDGTLAGVYTIAPTNRSRALTDAAIQKELAIQLRKGALPASTSSTIYMLHFPAGVHVTMQGGSSCQPGGFCGYHGTYRSGSARVRYAVIPDMSKGSGCDTGCGGGTPLASVTSVASHELVEVTTDPDVGLATGLGPPLAWYDATNGEISDICAGHQGTLRVAGASWTVSKQWSNRARACVLSGP